MSGDLTKPCRFGYVEHDGYQYCFEHHGWHHYTDRTMRCDAVVPRRSGA